LREALKARAGRADTARMSLPRVTVALSVRNGAAYIADSIESVLAQTGVDLELRVYDNGSTDGTLDVVGRYLDDPRVSLTRNPDGMTFPHSMNRAAVESARELFCPWAADDVMLAGNLAAKADALAATGAALAFGPIDEIDAAGRRRGSVWPAISPAPALLARPNLFAAVVPCNVLPMPSVVIRTDVLRALGGFDTRIPRCCDWNLWLRLGLRFDAVWVPDVLVHYRQHDDNGSAEGWRDGTFAAELPAVLAAALADEELPPAWREHAGTVMADLLVTVAGRIQAAGVDTHARGELPAHDVAARALVHAPASPGLRALWAGTVGKAGLVAPPIPARAAAWLGDADGAPALVDEVRRLVAAGLVRTCGIATVPDRLHEVADALGRALADGPDLDLDLAPGTLADVLMPGTLLIAPFGHPGAAAAARAGIPAVTHGWPDPFTAPRDPARYEIIAA
jgi:hypothetical protein